MLSVTPLTLAVSVLAVPAVVPVKTTVYVPGVVVAETVPNVPVLTPAASAKLKALLARPLIALPAASLTRSVSRSVSPEATVDDAKLAVEVLALTDPVVTWTVGLVLRATPSTFTVRVLAVPAVVPVKRAVYDPGVAVGVTALNVPALVPPARLKLNAEVPRPLTALPVVSSATMVSRSVLPEPSVGLAKLTLEFVGLIV